MGDVHIFSGGVFVTLWLVSFFGYSAFQLRRTVATPIPALRKNGG